MKPSFRMRINSKGGSEILPDGSSVWISEKEWQRRNILPKITEADVGKRAYTTNSYNRKSYGTITVVTTDTVIIQYEETKLGSMAWAFDDVILADEPTECPECFGTGLKGGFPASCSRGCRA